MAEKLTVTRAQVLDAVVSQNWDFLAQEDARKCAERMLASITRKADTPKQPSKAAKENAALAAQVLAVMPDGEPVLTSWVMEHVKGIMTPNKCSQVMKVLVTGGYAERVPKANGRYMGYRKL